MIAATLLAGSASAIRAGCLMASNRASISHALLDACLLQNGIGKMARHDGRRHWKGFSNNWTVPNLMTALALACERAAVRTQDVPQLRVKATAHALQGNAVIGQRLVKRKAQTQILRGNAQAVFLRHIGCKIPHALSQGLKAGSFGAQAQFITNSNKHVAFGIERYFDREGLDLDNVGHAPIIAPSPWPVCLPGVPHVLPVLQGYRIALGQVTA